MSVTDKLTPDMARHRIMNSAEAAEFWGVSLPHWRRLYRDEKVPRPVRVGTRKLGWSIGLLIDALEARSSREVA
jgi:predicted DNA-binding transcriptional regulator AlpA